MPEDFLDTAGKLTRLIKMADIVKESGRESYYELTADEREKIIECIMCLNKHYNRFH